MSTATVAALSTAGLTVLTEDEEMFRASVREFAEGEVRPRVEQMEHASKLDGDLIKQCFELGLMAIESPEEYGGAGSTIGGAGGTNGGAGGDGGGVSGKDGSGGVVGSEGSLGAFGSIKRRCA